ncbi:type VI secretion system baseplate subunit TssE, partial [Metapseudomonas otitidis]|uniref:type VI secretion system baseplate subunit TssE n=1 Tax=Metapseudomonas otitidis TaxID=319939 RepID=UPI00244AFA30
LHDALNQARAAIERFIEAYEPRLQGVRVVVLPRRHDPLNLSFSIEGTLNIDGTRRQVSFAAHLDGSGKVKVQ